MDVEQLSVDALIFFFENIEYHLSDGGFLLQKFSDCLYSNSAAFSLGKWNSPVEMQQKAMLSS